MVKIVEQKEEKDYSLNSGERQTATTVDGIRFDHRVRYQFAIEVLSGFEVLTRMNVLDIFCGNGYGTYMISQQVPNAHITGTDASKEAIEAANEHFKLSNNCFTLNEFPFSLPRLAYDVVICFESLEHVERYDLFAEEIMGALRPGGKLFLSTPNDSIHSLALNPHKFHFKHYTTPEIRGLFQGIGSIDAAYGQNIHHFDLHGRNTHQLLPIEQICLREAEGQVNLYVITKK